MYTISRLTGALKKQGVLIPLDDSTAEFQQYLTDKLNGVEITYVDFFEEEVQEIQNQKIALNEKYPEVIGMNYQLLQLDNLPGIKRLEPISDKGLKGEKKYTKDGQLIWSITTKYWFENDSSYTDGVVKIVKLLNVGGEVIDTWIKEVALSVDDKEQILKEQRECILTYFKSQQPVLFGLLYTFFKSDIDTYVSVGNKAAFEVVLTDASVNHPYQDQNDVYVVRETLSMQIPTQAGGTTTVLQGILNELV